jgi:membrane-bound ClpP family serine protease
MSVIAIVLIILLGIALLLIEFLVLPGITVAGIGGAALMITGVYMTYSHYGVVAGNYTLLGTGVISFVAVAFALRAKTWKRISLNTAIDGKMNTLEPESVKAGDMGVAMTRLAPMGKIKINGQYLEAESRTGYIDEQTEVEVIKVTGSSIIVKHKKK